MDTAISRNGVPIRLTDERWDHITRRHMEMGDLRDQVMETLAAPEQVQQGDFGELLAIRPYTDTPLGPKHLVAVYREVSPEDGFVLTAYLTRRPSRTRVILWKR